MLPHDSPTEVNLSSDLNPTELDFRKVTTKRRCEGLSLVLAQRVAAPLGSGTLCAGKSLFRVGENFRKLKWSWGPNLGPRNQEAKKPFIEISVGVCSSISEEVS